MPRLSPDWQGYDDTCIAFLTSLEKKGTAHTYKAYLKHFLKFKQMTGKQILEDKRNSKNYETEIFAFKQYLKTQKTQQGKNFGTTQ
jgi:hypothetical protein